MPFLSNSTSLLESNSLLPFLSSPLPCGSDISLYKLLELAFYPLATWHQVYYRNYVLSLVVLNQLLFRYTTYHQRIAKCIDTNT